ncbi:hypothetical protein BP6252_09656 [Coleophoma cylindrospora]|uniref:Amidohydrolase-related domain-containing protein n=1 Tax=Coleophoma cylindrospora TaxID=1849047 RepID=A0A3D8QWF1_9HELO|nr:hypothetical protein BP6252_09656 [Coleophoma cylindrospora]
MASSPPSTLYIHGTIITVNATRDILLDGAIQVTGNTITAIAKTSSLLDSPTLPQNTHIIDLQSRIVLPGLINAHAHVIQSLIRGLAEDLDLYRWACDVIWPMEASMQLGDGYDAARLAMCEMIKSGTTCFLEPMLPSQAGFGDVVKAVDEVGIRGCLGTLVKAPNPNARAGAAFTDARDRNASDMSVDAAVARHKQYHGSLNGRLHVWLAAETPRGVDESIYSSVGKACLEHGIRLTVHIAEDARDRVAIKNCYHASPVQFCENNHITGAHSVLGHMIHLDLATDLDILHRTGTSVAHNPTANAKLADGIAAVPQMLARGINVALGTDGAPCSNTYDLFRDMHMAGVIHKGVTQDCNVLSAEQVLEMATINGAKALGLEHETGSLEPGKKADFVVVDPSGLHACPYDVAQLGKGGMHPVTAVVHSCTGQDVRMVVVDGVVVVRDGEVLSVDEEVVKRRAREATLRMRERCAIGSQPLKMGWRYV